MPLNDPVPSSAADVLEFSAKRLDEVATSDSPTYSDRFGNTRRTVEGLEQLVRALVADVATDAKIQRETGADVNAAAGLITLTDMTYEVGQNQIFVFVNGVMLDLAAGEYSETSVSSVTINQTLAADDNVAVMTNQVVGAALARDSYYVDDMPSLAAVPRQPNVTYNLRQFWGGTGYGGGQFVWNPDRAKADHDGGLVIDPDKISQLGAIGVFGTYFTAAVSGTGCFERVDDGKFLNALWFGFVPDWNGTTGTDNAPAWIQLGVVSQNDKRDILLPVGACYISNSGVGKTFYSTLCGQSNLSSELVFEPPATDTSCYVNADFCSSIFVKIKPSVKDSTKTFSPTLPDYPSSLDYSSTLYGPAINKRSKVIGCYIEGMDRGCTGGGTCKDVQLIGSYFEGGTWGLSFYNKRGIDVTDCNVVGGNSGGAAFPSCKDVTYKGGWVYNPNGTGVNSGGAATAGFNAENITVTGVRVMARDCVNLENGCEYATITGNNITVLTQLATNGVAVGVFSRESDGGGAVSNVVVTGNNIHSPTTYSDGIKVGYSTTTTGIIVHNVNITANKVELARQGINLVSPASSFCKQVTVSDNTLRVGTKGLTLGSLEDFDVSNNNISRTSSTTVSATPGIEFSNLKKGYFDSNRVKGMYPHYEQNGLADGAQVWMHKGFRNDDEGAFILLINNSANADIVFRTLP